MFMHNFLLLVVRHFSLCVCGDDVSAVKSKLLSEKSAEILLLLRLPLLSVCVCVCVCVKRTTIKKKRS